MADIAARRIQRELRDIVQSEVTEQRGIKVELKDGSLDELRCEIKGPPDTPYEGGIFELEIKIPENYPFEPPSIRFVTKIWHANISSKSGFICSKILEKQWSISLTLKTIVVSIQDLLAAPELDDPQDMIVASQFQKNPEMFKLTARHWTNVYAGGPSKNPSCEAKIRKLIELGSSEANARKALSSFNWDLEYAINLLFPKNNCNDDNSNDDDHNEDD